MYESELCWPQDVWTLTFRKNCSWKDNAPTRDSSRGYLNVPLRGSFRGDPLAHFPAPTVATRPWEEPLRIAVIPVQVKITSRGAEPQAVRKQEGASMLSRSFRNSLDSGFKGAQG